MKELARNGHTSICELGGPSMSAEGNETVDLDGKVEPKRAMRFLFVHPKVAARGDYYEFPLGPAYVSSSVKAHGVACSCLNLCHDDRPVKDQLAEAIERHRIDVVCTGGMSIILGEVDAVVRATRQICPSILIVVGGAIVTSQPDVAARAIRFDFGVIGEGELAMCDLADAMMEGRSYREVKGLIVQERLCRNPGPDDASAGYLTTVAREEIAELDTLPIPDYEGFEYGQYIRTFAPTCLMPHYSAMDEPRAARIISSRSCPFSCTFCYHPLGKKYRQRSIDNVFQEVEYLRRHYQINMLYFLDELFALDRARVLMFCERIKAYGLKWSANLRVSDVDEDLLCAMKSAGAYAVGFGVESMSSRILKSMKKNTTPSQVDRALALTRGVGLGIQGNIIFGDPEESESTVKECLDWWMANRHYGIILTMVRVLPDSQIYRDAINQGLIADIDKNLRDGFPLINISKLSRKAFTRLCDFVYWFGYGYDERLLLSGEVIASERNGSDELGRPQFSVTVQCPECQAKTPYRNFTQQGALAYRGHVLVFCRSCWLRVAIRSRDAFAENYRLKHNSLLKYLLVNAIDFVACHKWAFYFLNRVRLCLFTDRRIGSLMSFIRKQ